MRYRLRTLLLLLTILAVGFGLFVSPFQRRARAIATIQSLGGSIVFDYQWTNTGAYIPDAQPPGPRVLRRVLGEHYDARVLEVHIFSGPMMHPEKFTDAMAAELRLVPEVTWLVLEDTQMTDKGLRSLEGLARLERIDLEGIRLSRDGVERLKAKLPGVQVYF